MRWCFVIAVLLAAAASSAGAVKLPDYIKPCKAKDSSCLKNLLKELGPHLVQGIPEFNIPSIDPWNAPNFNQSDNQSLSYFITITNMKYTGLSNFNVLKFDIDIAHSKFDLSLFFPQVVVTDYEVISGVGFGVSINGSGPTTTTFSNLTVAFSLNAEEISIKDKVYLKWKEDAITVSFDRVVYDLDSSFIDGKNYKKVLDLLNEKYPEVLNPQMQENIKISFGEFVLRSINFVHGTYPVDVLYLAP